MLDETAALAAVRADFPWWVGFAPLAFVPFAVLLALAGVHVAVSLALIAHRGIDADAHWTERARRAYPARLTAEVGPLGCAILLGIAVGTTLGPLSLVPARLLGLLTGCAVFVATSTQIDRVDRLLRAGSAAAARERFVGQVFVFFVLGPHVLIVLLGGLLMPEEPLPALIVFALLVALCIAVALGAGVRLSVTLGVMRPADERLRGLVDACGDQVGVRAKRVWIVRWPVVNALAFPRRGDIAFTERAAAELGDEHLRSITAHELAHLGESRSVGLARSVGFNALLPVTLFRPLVHAYADTPLRGVLVVFVLWALGFVIAVAVQRLARRMEERADAVAHAHEADPGAYARALERIYELNLVPAVTGAKRPVHPHLFDRLVSAGITPDHPRPSPPPRAATAIGALAMLAILAGGMLMWTFGLRMNADERTPSMLASALRGIPRSDLAELGETRWAAGDLDGALRYYRALSAIDRGSGYWPAAVASLAAHTGRCDEGRAALLEATMRANGDPSFTFDVLPEITAELAGCVPLRD